MGMHALVCHCSWRDYNYDHFKEDAGKIASGIRNEAPKKKENIEMSVDDDDDLESLRLYALQTLLAKKKTPGATTLTPPQPAMSGVSQCQGARLTWSPYQAQLTTRGRGFHRGGRNGVFQSHRNNSNLIAIVPVTEETENSVSKNKQVSSSEIPRLVLPQHRYCKDHSPQTKEEKVSGFAGRAVAGKGTWYLFGFVMNSGVRQFEFYNVISKQFLLQYHLVTTKFSRYEDSDSNSSADDSDESTDNKSEKGSATSEKGQESKAVEQKDDVPHNGIREEVLKKSGGDDDDIDDSIERLMDQLEEVIGDKVSDNKVVPIVLKKESPNMKAELKIPVAMPTQPIQSFVTLEHVVSPGISKDISLPLVRSLSSEESTISKHLSTSSFKTEPLHEMDRSILHRSSPKRHPLSPISRSSHSHTRSPLNRVERVPSPSSRVRPYYPTGNHRFSRSPSRYHTSPRYSRSRSRSPLRPMKVSSSPLRSLHSSRRSISPRRDVSRSPPSRYLSRINKSLSPRRSLSPLLHRSVSPRRPLSPRRSVSPKGRRAEFISLRRSPSQLYKSSPRRRSISPSFRRRSLSPRKSPMRRHSPSPRRIVSPLPHRYRPPSPRRQRSTSPRQSSYRSSPSHKLCSPSSRHFSPLPRRTSPSRHLHSPLSRQHSPHTWRQNSPAKQSSAASPSQRRFSPLRRQVSPPRRQLSPSRRMASPSRRMASPSRRMASPSRRQISPSRRLISPPRRQISPIHLPLSPLRRHISPVRRPISPSQRHISPGRRPISPMRRRTSPARRPNSPLRRQISPARRPNSPLRRQIITSPWRPNSPQRRQSSPARRPSTPVRRQISPARRAPSPLRRQLSPISQQVSPKRYISSSPRKLSPVPKRSRSPVRRNPSPPRKISPLVRNPSPPQRHTSGSPPRSLGKRPSPSRNISPISKRLGSPKYGRSRSPQHLKERRSSLISRNRSSWSPNQDTDNKTVSPRICKRSRSPVSKHRSRSDFNVRQKEKDTAAGNDKIHLKEEEQRKTSKEVDSTRSSVNRGRSLKHSNSSRSAGWSSSSSLSLSPSPEVNTHAKSPIRITTTIISRRLGRGSSAGKHSSNSGETSTKVSVKNRVGKRETQNESSRKRDINKKSNRKQSASPRSPLRNSPKVSEREIDRNKFQRGKNSSHRNSKSLKQDVESGPTDPIMEARRRKFESLNIVEPSVKKIRLKNMSEEKEKKELTTTSLGEQPHHLTPPVESVLTHKKPEKSDWDEIDDCILELEKAINLWDSDDGDFEVQNKLKSSEDTKSLAKTDQEDQSKISTTKITKDEEISTKTRKLTSVSMPIKSKRLNNVVEESLQNHLENLHEAFTERGYPKPLIKNLLRLPETPQSPKPEKPDTIPLVTKYYPCLQKINKILVSGFHILEASICTKNILKKPPVLVYKQPSSLRNLLVHPKLKTENGTTFIQPQQGSQPCNKTAGKTCQIHYPAATFSSNITNSIYTIKGNHT
uniref:Uncharacterized protein n=1 Tax=Timema poppense TaxID=170557 RepID=A0A7R9GVI7_TIMPO|nr:unnamed protein product [Timema poppensis]